jgi:hypothetical protein
MSPDIERLSLWQVERALASLSEGERIVLVRPPLASLRRNFGGDDCGIPPPLRQSSAADTPWKGRQVGERLDELLHPRVVILLDSMGDEGIRGGVI